MSEWTASELRRIATAGDLHISTVRQDGTTYSAPTRIWSVVIDSTLYVRAYYGTNSRWYRRATAGKAGRIRVAEIEKDVTFEAVDESFDAIIDGAYRTKYGASGYLAPMVSPTARAATLTVTPR